MPHKNFVNKNKQNGQTMIETLVAIFILVMGVSASIGLAVYALNSSTGLVKQIVATGLAREGIEIVKNIRDTNWLNDTLAVNDCYDYKTSQNNKADCYHDWLSEVWCIDPSPGLSCNGTRSTQKYSVEFESSDPSIDILAQDSSSDFGLRFDPSVASGRGFYYMGGTPIACDNSSGRSDYCRKIVINTSTDFPYDKDTGKLVEVKSQVWWVDRKCPRVADFDLAKIACKVEMITYLTNWKNY